MLCLCCGYFETAPKNPNIKTPKIKTDISRSEIRSFDVRILIFF